MMNLDNFVRGYLDAMHWTECNSDNPELLDAYNENGFSDEVIERAKAECTAFIAANADDLLSYWELTERSDDYAGHDFWLTRNRHGAGFWDRGAGQPGARLTDAAHRTREVYLYVGDDGKIYCE